MRSLRSIAALILLTPLLVFAQTTCSSTIIKCASGQQLYGVPKSTDCPTGGYVCKTAAPTKASNVPLPNPISPALATPPAKMSVVQYSLRSKSLQFSSSGGDVLALQQQLITLGYLVSGNATGYFGSLTKAAVQKFQRDYGIVSSGTEATTGYGAVGPKTKAALASSTSGSATNNVSQSGSSLQTLLAQLQALQAQIAALTGGAKSVSSYAGVPSAGSDGIATSLSTTSSGAATSNSTISNTTTASSSTNASASCTWNGQTIASGASVTAYQASSVANGASCQQESRSCFNGTLLGSYTNASCQVAAASPNRSADVQWFLDQHASIKSNYFAGKFGKWENPIGWWEGWYLRAYINMYEASKDVEVLRKLNELLKIVADGNDSITGFADQVVGKVMPGWGNTYSGAYGPQGGQRHTDITLNGLYMYPMAAFARIVKQTPSLQSEFGADADRYLAQIDAIFQAFKPYIKSDGTYSDGTSGQYYAYPDGYYETSNGAQENFGGMEEPINLTLVPAEAFAEAYRANGKQEYADFAAKAANYFWWQTSYQNAGGITWLTWDYWPAYAQTRPEDPSHGAVDVLFAKTMVESGISNPWNAARLQYLANTFTQSVMLNSTSMANYINGTGGSYSSNDAYICADWMALRPYDSNNNATMDIYQACKNIMEAAGQSSKMNIAVFANFYRYDPTR